MEKKEKTGLYKPYFAKHLPVEEEIKEGDITTNCHGDFFKADNGTVYFLSKELKKYKLFLCSRDIQVGDTLKECMPDGKEYKVHHFETVLPCGVFVMEPWPSDNEVWIHATDAFKVVGEISPEATWVKEGDQFEENEICKVGTIRRDIVIKEGIETRTAWGDRVKVLKLADDLTFHGHLCEYLDEADLNHNVACRKGETYEYHPNLLGYIDLHYYKILGPCGHFH